MAARYMSKNVFDNTVNLYRCLAQSISGFLEGPRYALRLADENERRNPRVACQEICLEDGILKKSTFPIYRGCFFLDKLRPYRCSFTSSSDISLNLCNNSDVGQSL